MQNATVWITETEIALFYGCGDKKSKIKTATLISGGGIFFLVYSWLPLLYSHMGESKDMGLQALWCLFLQGYGSYCLSQGKDVDHLVPWTQNIQLVLKGPGTKYYPVGK